MHTLNAIIHPFRWTRLFFKAILGTLPHGMTEAELRTETDYPDTDRDTGLDDGMEGYDG